MIIALAASLATSALLAPPADAAAPAEQPIVIRSGLALATPSPRTGARSLIRRDAVEAQLVAGTFVTPKEGAVPFPAPAAAKPEAKGDAKDAAAAAAPGAEPAKAPAPQAWTAAAWRRCWALLSRFCRGCTVRCWTGRTSRVTFVGFGSPSQAEESAVWASRT